LLLVAAGALLGRARHWVAVMIGCLAAESLVLGVLWSVTILPRMPSLVKMLSRGSGPPTLSLLAWWGVQVALVVWVWCALCFVVGAGALWLRLRIARPRAGIREQPQDDGPW